MSKHWLKVYGCSLLIFWQFIYLRFHDQVLWMLKFGFKKYTENFNKIKKFPTNGWSIKMPKSSRIRLFLRKGERLQRVEFQSICAVMTKFYGCWNSDTKRRRKFQRKGDWSTKKFLELISIDIKFSNYTTASAVDIVSTVKLPNYTDTHTWLL